MRCCSTRLSTRRALLIASAAGAAIERRISASPGSNKPPSRRLMTSSAPIGPSRGGQRHADDRARDETGFGVDAHVDARVVLRIAHDLVAFSATARPTMPCPICELQAGDIDRADAQAALDQAADRIDQEHRCRFGLHEIGDAPHRHRPGSCAGPATAPAPGSDRRESPARGVRRRQSSRRGDRRGARVHGCGGSSAVRRLHVARGAGASPTGSAPGRTSAYSTAMANRTRGGLIASATRISTIEQDPDKRHLVRTRKRP